MNESLEEIAARRDAIGGLVPFLDAIRAIAEIAWRRAEQRAEPLAAYQQQLEVILARVLGSIGDVERSSLLSWPGRPSTGSKTALLLITAERGLCGSFVDRLVAFGVEEGRAREAHGEQVAFMCLGRRGERRLTEEVSELIYSASLPSLAVPTYVAIEKIALDLLDLAESGAFTRLVVVHNVPTRRFQFEPGIRPLLPLDLKLPTNRARRSSVKPPFDAPAVLRQVLTEHFILGLYRCVLESSLSEQLARVFAMRLATDNARRLVDDLTDSYNLASRYAVTSSLLETITGYETTMNRRDEA